MPDTEGGIVQLLRELGLKQPTSTTVFMERVGGYIGHAQPATAEHKAVTCDSQHLLICLTQGTRKAKALIKENVRGYAAFIAFSPDGRMIVARDDMAKLYAVVMSNGRWVFGTTERIAESVASCFTSRPVSAFELEENIWLEFTPGQGKPKMSTWEIGRASYHEMQFSSRSLGTAAASNAKPGQSTIIPPAAGVRDPISRWVPVPNIGRSPTRSRR